MRLFTTWSCHLLAFSVLACVSWPLAAKAAEPAIPASPPKPPTHTVERGPIKIEVSFDGLFEAQEMTEIALTPKEWSSFTVLSAVEHGTRVKAGDVLVTLDTEKIDRAIEDLRLENELSALALKLAKQELDTQEKTVAMELAAGERAEKEVREDLEYYFGTSRDLTLRSAEFSLKNTEHNVEYTREELEQLEKMYEADDLTEETEEIILRRARNSLEQAEFSLERSRVSRDRTVDVLVPRQDADLEESAEMFFVAWAEAKAALPLELKRERLSLKRQTTRHEQSVKRLQELLADRQMMTVEAPVAGLLYHGKCVSGKFSGGSENTFRPGGNLPTKQAFMTIVKPRPMIVRASIAERDLHAVRGGLKGTAVPTGYPDMKLTVIVDNVAAIPTSSAKFDARITVALDEEAEPLMPGMGCKVTLISYENRNALTVPTRCLHSEDDDENEQYVYLVDEQGVGKKQPVTVGKRTSGKVEIVDGLDEGDQVLLSPPKDDVSANAKPNEDTGKSTGEDRDDSPENEATDSAAASDDDPEAADNTGNGDGVPSAAAESPERDDTAEQES